jgi:hypothetical protein
VPRCDADLGFLMEKFGTFRFLMTELVPLQLIHERLLSDSSLEATPEE